MLLVLTRTLLLRLTYPIDSYVLFSHIYLHLASPKECSYTFLWEGRSQHERQRELAEDFEVAESTVYRWASGLAVPHPKIQGLVVKWIKSRLSTSESRLGSASDSGTIPLAAKGK